MMSFRIHEDVAGKENMPPADRLRASNKDQQSSQLYGKILVPVPPHRIKKREPFGRRVLRQVENVQENANDHQRFPAAPKLLLSSFPCPTNNDDVDNHKNTPDNGLNDHHHHHHDDTEDHCSSLDMDRACELIRHKLDTPSHKEEDEDSEDLNTCRVLDMSVDVESHSAVKRRQHASYDERMERVLYTEPQYRKDIYRYLLEAEHHHRPHPNYMSKQTELNNDMRCILVDWLVSISDEYDLAPATLHLAVSLVDRFLSKMSVVRNKFQLLGVTAMMIAAKYEEVHPPDIYEFSSLTKDTCSAKQILKMEELMLRVLSFDLTTPTVQTFIEEYSVQGEMTKEATLMAMFIGELCLVESVDYIRYLPSEVAASSLALSRHTLVEADVWPKQIEEISNYSLTALYPILKMQHKVLEDSPNKALQAVRQKYSRESFRNVSRYIARKLM